MNEVNREIARKRMMNREKLTGIQVGDLVERKNGKIHRVAHIWADDDIQTSPGGSVYMHQNGAGSFSGGLDPSIQVEPTSRKNLASFWFFDSDRPGAGRGVEFQMMVRIYREV